MPERVEPCLALLAVAPTSDEWAFEVKWDGYRLAVHIEPGKVRIITRGGHDWTARFPTIAHDVLEPELDTAILDGEAVVLGERRCRLRRPPAGAGRARRQALRQQCHPLRLRPPSISTAGICALSRSMSAEACSSD